VARRSQRPNRYYLHRSGIREKQTYITHEDLHRSGSLGFDERVVEALHVLSVRVTQAFWG
jgi:hypothetical protein